MELILLSTIVIACGFSIIAFSLWKVKKIRADLEKRERTLGHKVYELAILKELSDRVGYSLDVHQIVDVITGSLHQLIEYSAVSYMLLEPEKIYFKIHLETSVHRGYVDEVKDRMLKSLSALLDREFKKQDVDEVLSGAILVNDVENPVRSLFNIPLVIAGKVVGLLTVTHTKAGLYKEEEMTILYKITSQASYAVTKLQEVVRAEQSKLNAMVSSMADGVIMTDLEHRIVVVNTAAKGALGLMEKKDISIFDLIDNLGGKFDIRGRLEESVKLSKTYVSEKVVLREKFYQIFVFPVISSQEGRESKVLGGVIILHDVTREMEVERIRDEFTSMLVHELRSPLDSIKKISEALRDKTIKVTAKAQKEYLQMIYQNSSGMLELVNDILDVAKLEAGKFDVRREPQNIKDIIENRVDFYKLTAKDANVGLNIVTGKDVPAIAFFDGEAIKQVLNNLISNAIKFTKSGGEVNVVAIHHEAGTSLKEEFDAAGITLPATIPEDETAQYPTSIVVAVSDNGIGISAENQKELFNKFKQFTSRTFTSRKKGTGLGLAIAKGIVEAHKGSVNVVSTEGAGTVFYFVLPLVETK